MGENKPKWRMKGKWIKNCNCSAGCPCDFWSKPTNTKCEGMIAMEIEDGNFEDIPLRGLKFAAKYHWPGPLHEGNGTMQAFIDAGATEKQREALLTILSGKAGNPWFEIVPSLLSRMLEPKFLPIEFECDIEKRHARVFIEGVMETVTKPIKNIATGDDHRIKVHLPHGMEYKVADVAEAVINKGFGEIKYNCPSGHSSLAYVEHTQEGLISH
ncbi:MAG: DUF1326 domain-containing protein [Candidatus Aenigmarchaeota archaeon]|nr:DUF1326 domain-containing protein [Candidatus Aenigmarchaeota archaeon]